MMKRYKALILDLDGTTIGSYGGSQPSIAVEQAIKAAHPHIKIAIATGRSWHLTESVIRQLAITEPCILDGGSRIVSPTTGRVYFSKLLSVAKQQEIIAVCLPLRYTIYITANQQTHLVTSLQDVTEPTGKIELENIPADAANTVLTKLAVIRGVAPHITSSWNPSRGFVTIHVTHQGATKEQSIKRLLNIMKVIADDTIGIGDSYNDIPLFASVGLKVAMGNAPRELTLLADYVAPDLEHDGVADVIRRFVI